MTINDELITLTKDELCEICDRMEYNKSRCKEIGKKYTTSQWLDMVLRYMPKITKVIRAG